MGIRVMVERVIHCGTGSKSAKDKDKKAKNQPQDRAGRSSSHLVLPVHEDLLSQRRASGKREVLPETKTTSLFLKKSLPDDSKDRIEGAWLLKEAAFDMLEEA